MQTLPRSTSGWLLVGALLEAGYSISVYDGEETVLKKSTDADDIFMALGSTDIDVLNVLRAASPRRGFVMLVWGNDVDVIHDWSGSVRAPRPPPA
jgi:hypothetical protein